MGIWLGIVAVFAAVTGIGITIWWGRLVRNREAALLMRDAVALQIVRAEIAARYTGVEIRTRDDVRIFSTDFQPYRELHHESEGINWLLMFQALTDKGRQANNLLRRVQMEASAPRKFRD
jgi:hypothetical protein